MSLLLSSMQPHARCGCSSCAVHNKSGALTLSLQWSCNLMYRYQSRAYTATCSLHQAGLSTASAELLIVIVNLKLLKRYSKAVRREQPYSRAQRRVIGVG